MPTARLSARSKRANAYRARLEAVSVAPHGRRHGHTLVPRGHAQGTRSAVPTLHRRRNVYNFGSQSNGLLTTISNVYHIGFCEQWPVRGACALRSVPYGAGNPSGYAYGTPRANASCLLSGNKDCTSVVVTACRTSLHPTICSLFI